MSFLDSITKIINSNFLTRLFSWREITNHLSEIKGNISETLQRNIEIQEENELLKQSAIKTTTEKEELDKKYNELENKKNVIEERLKILEPLDKKNQDLQKQINIYQQEKNSKDDEHQRELNKLNITQKNLDDFLKKQEQDAEKAKMLEFENKKKTWKNHQDLVQSTIKDLCNKYQITYVEKFPFEGKEPDNTIKISNDFVIFDAKAPYKDNLANFSAYIINQAERISKYAKYEEVLKELYLVVPSNTMECLKEKIYSHAQYTVRIITIDSLETEMTSLKKIEDYDFAEKLNPVDKNNISRALSGLVNWLKRDIQLNNWESKEKIQTLEKLKDLIPENFHPIIKEFEKGEHNNPPMQKKGKIIDVKDEITKHEVIKATSFHQSKIKKVIDVDINEEEIKQSDEN